MQRAALAAALLALTLALSLASASPGTVTVTVSYVVGGGYTGSYTPLVYLVNGTANLPWTLVLVYAPNATVSARSYPPTEYGALAGASLDYDPLLYGFQPQVVLGNATFRLNVHVRVLKGNNTLLPEFDVPYKVNGTSRVARRGEDSLDWTFSWIEMLVRDPLALEFPKEVEGCKLLNSSTVYADPRVQTDVWIYYSYGEAPSPTQPPSQPGQQPGAAGAAPSESPLERVISEAVWRFKLFLAWVLEWLARFPVPPNLLLLLLGLLLIALGLYLWWRRSRRFAIIIEVKG